MTDRVSLGSMLLALFDSGNEVPTPGSWPGRAPVVGSRLDVWASAAIAVTLSSRATVGSISERMWMKSFVVTVTRVSRSCVGMAGLIIAESDRVRPCTARIANKGAMAKEKPWLQVREEEAYASPKMLANLPSGRIGNYSNVLARP